MMPVPTASDVNFKGHWDTLIAAFDAATGSKALLVVAGIAGTIIVIAAVMSSLIAKRRGGPLFGGQDNHKIAGAVIAGAFLAAPKIVIPAALWVLGMIVNAVIQVLRNSGGAV